MVKHQISQPSLAIGMACCLCFSFVTAGERNGTEWKVTGGDTLYEIGRNIYPGDAARQSRLRQDIMMLNPDAFSSGAGSMQPGLILQLPQYVVNPQAAAPVPQRVQPAPAPVIDPTRATWTVESGETLYSISRSIFPQDAQKQSILRRDVVKLNRTIFADGNDTLAIGTALALPGYVDQDAQAKAARAPDPAPVPVIVPAQAKTEPAIAASAAKPAAADTVIAPEPVAAETTAQAPEPAAAETTAQSSTIDRRQRPPDPYTPDTNFLVSVGLATGGDKLVKVDEGFDITGGSGINLRLGYQQAPKRGHGFRTALGVQYHPVNDASLQNYYVQLAYQYRANPYAYGIGIAGYAGGELEDVDINIDFESSAGVFVFVENTGSDALGGFGLSLTGLELEEKESGDKVDASSAEIYYSWHF